MRSLRGMSSALMLTGAALALTGVPAQALNGTLYAVVSPTYTGSNGSTSFLRLFNGNQTKATTFTIYVVGTCTGNTYGTAPITVPSDASPQFPLSTILTLANTSTGQMTACDTASGVGPALYIQNGDPTASYEHVTFNPSTNLFEDVSNCKTLINEAFVGAGHNGLVLTNVHTSALAGNRYPSQISIHNFWNAAVTYHVSVYDAGTADSNTGVIRSGSGTKLGTHDYPIAGNSSMALTETQLESDIGWTPTSSQLHINVVVTDANGGPPYDVLGQAIVNNQLGGFVDMTNACAVNAVTSSGGGGGGPPPMY